MASVIMAKGTFIKVTNVGSPQAYLSPRKVSRVSFTSATTFNGVINYYLLHSIFVCISLINFLDPI